MKRVTTNNLARYLCIDKSGTTKCTIRISANGFNAGERKSLGLQVSQTRMHSRSPKSQSVSADGPANTAEAAVDLVSGKTMSTIPETSLCVMPLTGLDGSCTLGSEALKSSIEREETFEPKRRNTYEVFGAFAQKSDMAIGGFLRRFNSRRPEHRRNT